jgi:predicted GIY-YIG superfamily endonuclease
MTKAIARGKQFKGWRREKKLNLIRSINPRDHQVGTAARSFTRASMVEKPRTA